MAPKSAVRCHPKCLTLLLASSVFHASLHIVVVDAYFSSIDDSTPLNQVPFLMSHDTATGYLGEDKLYSNPSVDEHIIAWSKNQIGTVPEQLDCGARLFDMRPYLDKEGVLLMHHGGVPVNHTFADAMSEMMEWANNHTEEVILAEIGHFGGRTEEKRENCSVASAAALESLNMVYISEEQCLDGIMETMTLGKAKEMGKLPGGGHVLPIWTDCFVANYDPDYHCRGYEYVSRPGFSSRYTCPVFGENPEYPLGSLWQQLDRIHDAGPESDGKLWQMQALWQVTVGSVNLGTLDNSSILMDVASSRINQQLYIELVGGFEGAPPRWKEPNLFEVDLVCDWGPKLYEALDPNANLTLTEDDLRLLPDMGYDGVKLPPYDHYLGPTFKDNRVIRQYYRNQRWGQTKDIALFMNGSDSEQNSYRMGVYGWFIFLWCLFVVWGLVLIYCKFRRKIGLLAGNMPKRPTKSGVRAKAAATESAVGEKDEDSSAAKERRMDEEEIEYPADLPVPTDPESEAPPPVGPSGDEPEIDVDTTADEDAALAKTSRDDENDHNPDASAVGEEQYVNDVTPVAAGHPEIDVDVDATANEDAALAETSQCDENSPDPNATAVREEQYINEAVPLAAGGGVEGEDFTENELTEDELLKWQIEVRKIERTVLVSRVTVLICGIVILVCSGLMLSDGFKKIGEAVDSALITIPPLTEALERGNMISLSFLIETNKTRDERVKFLSTLYGECPGLNDTILDSNITGYDAILGINETLNNVTFIYDQVAIINETLYNITKDLKSLENTLTSVNDGATIYYIALGFFIAFDVVVAWGMIGVILAWKEKQPLLFRKTSTRCALPVFLFLLFAAYFLATYAMIFTMGTADLCIETPDNQIIRIIDAKPPFDEFVEFYVRQCNQDYRPDLLYDFFEVLAVVLRVLSRLLEEAASMDLTLVGCGNETSAIQDAIVALQVQWENYVMLIYSLHSLTRCEIFNPIYSDLFYWTICDKGTFALGYTFAYLVVIAVCSMVIVTFRVAWYQLEDELDDVEDKSDGGGDKPHWRKRFGNPFRRRHRGQEPFDPAEKDAESASSG